MAIFNKDGKVYVLEGPNPLVEKQVSWDFSKLLFHNFNWDEVTSAEKLPRRPITSQVAAEQNKEPANEVFLSHNTKRSEEEAVPAKKEMTSSQDAAIEEPPPEPKEFDLPHIKHKVLSYCLPAKVHNKTDKFYGESWMRITYGEKIIFPSVMVESTDLQIQFWSSDPNGKITEKSVIYPFAYEIYNKETDSYDRVPYDEYRWWKISEKNKVEEGGWLFTAVPSDVQPDFSD